MWYAVISAPRLELLAEKIIKGLGHETLLPVEPTATTSRRRASWYRRRTTDGETEAVRPILSGFVFARMAPKDFPSLYGFSPILGFLGMTDRPSPLTSKDMANLRAIASGDALRRETEAPAMFAQGVIVRVTEGPAQGLCYHVVGQVGDLVTGEETQTGLSMKIPANILRAV